MNGLLLTVLMLLFPLSAFGGNSARNFGGVGIDGVPWADGSIVVKQVVLGGPAQLGGVHVGDIISHIDGKPTRGGSFREMVDFRLRGRAGSKVTLKIRRPGQARPLTFTLTRRQLTLGNSKQGP